MIIKKNTIIEVDHIRKGKFFAMALDNFDTEKTEFYQIALAQVKPVIGLNTEWEVGGIVPCRGSLCKIKIIKEDN